jgi:hypothetical protein
VDLYDILCWDYTAAVMTIAAAKLGRPNLTLESRQILDEGVASLVQILDEGVASLVLEGVERVTEAETDGEGEAYVLWLRENLLVIADSVVESERKFEKESPTAWDRISNPEL